MANLLDSLVNQKMQKMQQQNMLRALFSQQQQRPDINSEMDRYLEYIPSKSPNLGDFLQGGPRNAIEQSVGRTPFQLPGLSRAIPSMQQPTASIQQPSMLEESKSAGQKTEEAKAKSARQARIDNETFPYYEKIKAQSAQAPEIDARLDEMDELLNTGKVQSGTMIAALDSLKDVPVLGKFAGVVEQALLTDETRVFKKLSTDFLRDAKPYFGSNMSTSEVMLFLERVPSLMQSNEGNRAVIRNFRAMNDYTKAVDRAMEQIIAENGGERPRHIQSKVANSPIVKKAGEDLRKAFKDSVKLIPSSQVGKNANEFSSLPKAKDYSGRTITDTQTGTKYKSNGVKWVKA